MITYQKFCTQYYDIDKPFPPKDELQIYFTVPTLLLKVKNCKGKIKQKIDLQTYFVKIITIFLVEYKFRRCEERSDKASRVYARSK